MTAEDTRKPAAHEQLNEIAARLDSVLGGGVGAHVTRLHAVQPVPAMAPPAPEPPPPQPEPAVAVPEAPPVVAVMPPEPPRVAPPPPPPPTEPAAPAPVPVRPVAAAKGEPRMRSVLITYFPMLIAIMSLAMSFYQGWLFNSSRDVSRRSLDLMERNVARGEYIRACREIIETYFQIKPKVAILMPHPDRGNVAGASRVAEQSRLDAQAAIAKFGGLGTYLANFQDAGTRARYTELTRTLNGIMETARTTQLTDIDKLFEPADKIFSSMNDDCVRLARAMRM